jgi:hypothetical protein
LQVIQSPLVAVLPFIRGHMYVKVNGMWTWSVTIQMKATHGILVKIFIQCREKSIRSNDRQTGKQMDRPKLIISFDKAYRTSNNWRPMLTPWDLISSETFAWKIWNLVHWFHLKNNNCCIAE